MSENIQTEQRNVLSQNEILLKIWEEVKENRRILESCTCRTKSLFANDAIEDSVDPSKSSFDDNQLSSWNLHTDSMQENVLEFSNDQEVSLFETKVADTNLEKSADASSNDQKDQPMPIVNCSPDVPDLEKVLDTSSNDQKDQPMPIVNCSPDGPDLEKVLDTSSNDQKDQPMPILNCSPDAPNFDKNSSSNFDDKKHKHREKTTKKRKKQSSNGKKVKKRKLENFTAYQIEWDVDAVIPVRSTVGKSIIGHSKNLENKTITITGPDVNIKGTIKVRSKKLNGVKMLKEVTNFGKEFIVLLMDKDFKLFKRRHRCEIMIN